jgi:hypothetical protein
MRFYSNTISIGAFMFHCSSTSPQISRIGTFWMHQHRRILESLLTVAVYYLAAISISTVYAQSSDPCKDVLLCNTSFEQVNGTLQGQIANHYSTTWHAGYAQTNKANVPCWNTSEVDSLIEIWQSGFGGIPAFSGGYFAELNATTVGTLSQTFSVTGAISIVVSFAHRGRYINPDVMKVSVEPVNGSLPKTYLGKSNAPTDIQYSDNDSAWRYYTTAPYAISNYPATWRVNFESISSGGNDPAGGNFLDSITVTCSSASNVPPCTPAPANLVAWWPFDETAVSNGSTGIDLTSVPASYAPTNTNNVANVLGSVTSSIGSYVNNSYFFPGTSGSYVNVTPTTDLDFPKTSFSIDAWIKLADTNATRKTIISHRVVGSNGYSTGYTLYIDELHRLNLQLGIGAANPGFATGPIPLGNWTFIAATINRTPSAGAPGGTVKLYVNNAITTYPLPLVWAGYDFGNTGDVRIGQLSPSTYSDDPFHGNIDELEVFDAAVDSTVLVKIFRAQQAGKCRTTAAVTAPYSSESCCDTAYLGVASSQVLNCIGCYPNNRDWRSINIVNHKGSPITGISIGYYDCSGHPITGTALAQLTGQNLHSVRTAPYLNKALPASDFVNFFQTVNNVSLAPAPAIPSMVSFDLGLPCNANPGCWQIRLIIRHRNPSAPGGEDTCYATLADWKPCPRIFPGSTWGTVAKIDSPIFISSVALNEGVSGSVGYVSVATADSTDKIVGTSGAPWITSVNTMVSDSSGVASVAQSNNSVLYTLKSADTTGLPIPPTFTVFVSTEQHSSDRKYRPTLIYGTYDANGGLLTTDTIQMSQEVTNIVHNPGIAQTSAIEITSIQPNPARNSIEVEYQLGANEQAKLELYNALGNQVGILADGYQTMGMHTAHYVVSTLPAGSYYVRLSTYNGQTSATVKVVH